MNVLQLKLDRYRSYDDAVFTFEPDVIHILQGANAQGKTNIVEAIYFLSHLRSFRTSQTASLIEHGESGFALEAKAESHGRTEKLRIYMDRSHKQLYRYGQPVRSFSDFVGILNAVLFCPDDLSLFTDGPSARRRFIDMELVKLSKNYTALLGRFQKLLHSRNTLLKSPAIDNALLDVVTEQLIEAEELIAMQRSRFTSQLMEKAEKLYPFFSEGRESFTGRYKTFVDVNEDMKSQMRGIYEKSGGRDRKMQQTTCGVHKDDVQFYLDGHPVALNASQGQKRSALLTLKLALCQMIYEKSGQYPILLLDDVFSELDSVRQQKFVELLPKDMQVFITTATEVHADWNGRKVVIHEIRKKEKESKA